jgi:hypothetical protein
MRRKHDGGLASNGRAGAGRPAGLRDQAQARRQDHFVLRTISVCAASYRAVRASSSPHPPILSGRIDSVPGQARDASAWRVSMQMAGSPAARSWS